MHMDQIPVSTETTFLVLNMQATLKIKSVFVSSKQMQWKNNQSTVNKVLKFSLTNTA